jgi:hypothetical protein
MEPMKLSHSYLFLLVGAFLFFACEEEFIPEIDPDEQELIVEGFIEKGEGALPPYVLISKSIPFFGSIQPSDIAELQIRDAEVKVTFEGNEYELPLVCLSELPEEVRNQIIEEVGVLPDLEDGDFCVYIDILRNIPIQSMKPYSLFVALESGDILEAKTIIPNHVPIDSFRFTSPPGENENDTMARLLITVTDPPGPNYYRYLTAGQDEVLQASFASVTDDGFFDGETFDFPLQKAVSPQDLENGNPENFGLYRRGDTVRIRWLNIDKDHFAFWNTFEFNLNNQGPFSSYTRVSSNVSGAIGIWGGYSSSLYKLEVPKE